MGLPAAPLAPTVKPWVYVPPASHTVSPGCTHDQLIWSISPQALLQVVPADEVVPADGQGLAAVPGAPFATYQLLPVSPSGGPLSASASSPPPASAPKPASEVGLASMPASDAHPDSVGQPPEPAASLASVLASGAAAWVFDALPHALERASITASSRPIGHPFSSPCRMRPSRPLTVHGGRANRKPALPRRCGQQRRPEALRELRDLSHVRPKTFAMSGASTITCGAMAW